MKRFSKIILWICFILTVFLAFFSVTIDLGIETSKRDANLYHLGGFFMMMIIATGFFVETGILSIKKKLKIYSIKSHIFLWIVILGVSITCFSICNGITSQDFKDAMNAKNQSKEQSSQKESDIKAEESIITQTSSLVESTEHSFNASKQESDIVDNTNQTVLEESVKEFTIQESKEDSVVIIEPTETDNVSVNIDGLTYNFEDAVYTVNGIEVTIHSVAFNKIMEPSGYELLFSYSVKNKNNTDASIEFAISGNQFRCKSGKAPLNISAMNATDNKYSTSIALKAGTEDLDNLILFNAISMTFPKTIDGIAYEPIEIDDIFEGESMEIDIVINGWVNSKRENLCVTFYLQ